MIKEKKTNKNNILWKWVLYVSGGLIVFLVFILGIIWLLKPDMEKRGFEDRGVLAVEIQLNGTTLDEINGGDKETKYEGNKVAVYENGEMNEYNNVQIKGRGNSTWRQEKKPYQIKFSSKTDFLHLGIAKKWTLLANIIDDTNLRNDIALSLAEMIEMPYNYRGDFVDLYIDGDYRGLYYTVQKIEMAKGSVDLRRNDGVIFELDNLHRDEENCLMTYLDECLVLKDGVMGDDNLDSFADAFIEDFNKAEKAVKDKSYVEIEKIFDMQSFAKYFLINEFTVNPDAYSTSFYLYRNDEGKIAAGPVWDFDFALANRRWECAIDDRFYSPTESMIRKREAFGYDGLSEDTVISKLFYYLMDIPEFQKLVKEVFQKEMSGRGVEFVNSIIMKAKEIRDAAIKNRERWNGKDYDSEVNELVEWVKLRYSFFEETYGDGKKSIKVI